MIFFNTTSIVCLLACCGLKADILGPGLSSVSDTFTQASDTRFGAWPSLSISDVSIESLGGVYKRIGSRGIETGNLYFAVGLFVYLANASFMDILPLGKFQRYPWLKSSSNRASRRVVHPTTHGAPSNHLRVPTTTHSLSLSPKPQNPVKSNDHITNRL
jgi:hypothetical protein